MSNAGIQFPWIRRIKVTFEGPGANTYECDGTQEKIRAVAKIHKVIQSIPSATNLLLWNLSKDTRNSFQRGKTKIRIEAGWDHGPGTFAGLRQCFRGSFVTASSMRAGSDIVTSINAISAVDDLTTTSIFKTWAPRTPVKDIVMELARALLGVRLDPDRIRGLEGKKVGDKGWTHADTVRSALEKLSAEFGFSWTICDEYFQAVKDMQALGGNTTIRDPYLIDINPVFTGQGIIQGVVGLRIRCAFDATINPMFNIGVKSQIEPRYNGGGYTVQTVDHDLGCFAGDPFMTMINTRMEVDRAKEINGF